MNDRACPAEESRERAAVALEWEDDSAALNGLILKEARRSAMRLVILRQCFVKLHHLIRV
jgi:hypothetical protein